MHVACIPADGFLQVVVAGKLDAVSAPQFEEKVLPMMKTHGMDTIFNLAELSYVSSSGLRVFLQAAKQAREDSTRVALAGLQPMVREVFDLAGFTQFFTVATDLESAVHSLKED